MNDTSLLIPCYNAAKYLPRIWEAINAQTVPFSEIICFDDGSTDNTAEIAKSLGAKLIGDGKNHGASYARNQLAKSASCTWIHLHDADDTFSQDLNEKMGARMSEDVDVVICNAEWVEEGTENLQILWRYHESELLKNPVKYLIEHPVGVNNGYFRRDFFLKNVEYSTRLVIWEDSDIYVKLAAVGARFAVVEETLSKSYRHGSGIVQDQNEVWKYRLMALQDYSSMFNSALFPTLAKQAEIAADNMIRVGNRKGAIEAIELCQKLGGNPPSTSNPILRTLKKVMPPVKVMELTQRYRKLRTTHRR